MNKIRNYIREHQWLLVLLSILSGLVGLSLIAALAITITEFPWWGGVLLIGVASFVAYTLLDESI